MRMRLGRGSPGDLNLGFFPRDQERQAERIQFNTSLENRQT